MRRNEAKRKLQRLFVLGVFCLIGTISVQTKAEDAFVVEEEAIIGGGQVQEGAASVAPPPQRQDASPPVRKKKPTPSKKSKAGKQSESEQQLSEEPGVVEISENTVSESAISENAISQNSVVTQFRVPMQKKETKMPVPKETLGEKMEAESQKQNLQKEDEPKARPMQGLPWWLLGAGVVFFFVGCVRGVQRVKIGKKNARI